MAEYRASVDVVTTVERAFAVLCDASRFPQWQALAIRVVDQTGPLDRRGSSVVIDHGPGLKRTLTVVDADPPNRLRFQQQGIGMSDTTEVQFRTIGAVTRITMTAELRVKGGPLGRLLERMGRGASRREFQAELERFGALVDRAPSPPPPPGTLVSADCGAGFRILKVLETDDRAVHLALLAGASRNRPTDATDALDRESRLPDPLALRELDVSARSMGSKIVSGLPALRLDGGVGVPHVALSRDAFADARPLPLDKPIEVWPEERAQVQSWRDAAGPVLGTDIQAGITTLMTVRMEAGYGAAKLLHAEHSGVHLRIYSDRWDHPPDEIDPWRLALGTVSDRVLGLGHVPLSHQGFRRLEPRFARLVMIGSSERDGYRTWLEHGGGFFG